MNKKQGIGGPKKILKPRPNSGSTKKKSQPERVLPNFKTFAQQMKAFLPGMSASQRRALLKELHTLGKGKNLMESELSRERRGANIAFVFRKFRLWLVDLDKELAQARQAMYNAADIANSYPKLAELDTIDLGEDDLDKNELQKLIVGKTLRGLGRAKTEIEKVMLFVKDTQYFLAAATNPKLRTRAEKKLVLEEPKGLTHHLLVGKKTPQIDLAFLRAADVILKKYQNKNGQSIPSKVQILAKVFEYAFGRFKTESSIGRDLSPSRSKLR